MVSETLSVVLLLSLFLVACTCGEDDDVEEWERWGAGDVNGDGRPDLLLRRPVGCTPSGCEHIVLEEGGATSSERFRGSALICAVQDTFHHGYADIDCVRLIQTEVREMPELRVTERFRKGTTRYIGQLDHLDKRGDSPGCTTAEVTKTTSLFVLPAWNIKVSQRSSTGWRQGQKRTPLLGPLIEGASLEVSLEAIDPQGRRWLGVSRNGELAGWVPAESTSCGPGRAPRRPEVF